jgi:hypothetical protein
MNQLIETVCRGKPRLSHLPNYMPLCAELRDAWGQRFD